MAHKGYGGPVCFRRDFTQNVSSNRAGYPEKWIFVSAFNSYHVPYWAGQPMPFISGPAEYPTDALIRWHFPTFTNNGYLWEFMLQALKVRTPDRQRYFEWRITIGGVIGYQVFDMIAKPPSFGIVPESLDVDYNITNMRNLFVADPLGCRFFKNFYVTP